MSATNEHRDDKEEALEGSSRDFVRMWLEAWDAASVEEETWRETLADEAQKAYVGDPASTARSFNIFHSNMETLLPALYNSTPIPDVRRRFNDDDPVSMAVAELLERGIGFSIDDYDFDDTIKLAVKDMAIVDRGIARVRYDAVFGKDGEVAYETAQCEYVPFRSFRRGPARQWKDVPWIGFEHFLPKKEVLKLLEGNKRAAEILKEIPFTYSAASTGETAKDTGREVPRFGGRARILEIWDKDEAEVIFICADYSEEPVKRTPDPLGLRDFFPIPRPAMVITSTDHLIPIPSYSIYAELIEELNEVNDRITKLVKQLRVRGGYAGMSDEIELIAEAEDGKLIALQSAEQFASMGGLDKAISWFPLEPTVKALEHLIQHRELVKQTIYEVTGLSDIIRGASDAAETATAQQIKQQWGSVRIQGHQQEVARFCRDLFRLKAELFAKQFDIQTLLMMTGLKYPTQQEKQAAEQMKQLGEQAIQSGEVQADDPMVAQGAAKIEEVLSEPSLEEVQALLKDDSLRRYRVDIESDSTVRADLTKNQEQMKGFLEGTAQFVQSVGPMVQNGIMPGEVAIDIYKAFARSFRLGKQPEDTLEKWAEKARTEGIQGPPPDPEKEAKAVLIQAQAKKTETEGALLPEQFKLEREKQRIELGLAMNKDAREADGMAFEQDARDREMANNEYTTDRDMALRERDIEERTALGREGIAEQKAGREQSEKLERMKLADGRSARAEGYQMTAQTQPTEMDGEGKPLPPREITPPDMMPLEGEMMTSEEQARMAQSEALMQEVSQGLAALGQAQQESTQMLAQAIAQLTQALTAPKQIVRDASGKALGVAPVPANAAE